ncbi:MAG: glycosyltransferase family 4 protein [Bacteroidales bacterium]|nr:glycosyltransferase family 4 protein [Bacteroidales bacterium]
MPTKNKILIITYYWPPCGGAGVQRWLKFTKYLPDFGWEPFVLTVDPAYAQYPAIDESLEKDINPALKVYKTKAVNYFILGKSLTSQRKITSGSVIDNNIKSRIARFIRGNFFIPDPRKGWNRYAVRKASELIREEAINYVVTTSPPHSTQLIGLKLKSLFPGIKWICDLRDPWTEIYYYSKFYGTWPARMHDKKLEKRVLEKSDIVITVGQGLADLFTLKLQSNGKKITVISNGYDEQDFRLLRKKPPGKFTITYVGALSDQYPVTTLIKSFQELIDKGIEFNFRFIGTCPPGIKKKIASVLPDDAFYYLSYRSHREALTAMITSSVLVLLLPYHEENRMIITGKIFEYLRSEIPILAIGPEDGDAANIIVECGAGKIFDENDIKGITDYLSTDIISKIKYKAPEKYNRRLITARLTEELKRL